MDRAVSQMVVEWSMYWGFGFGVVVTLFTVLACCAAWCSGRNAGVRVGAARYVAEVDDCVAS